MLYRLLDDLAFESYTLAAGGRVHRELLAGGPLADLLVVLRVGDGPRHIAVKANAHADEPSGTVTCLELARWLADDPAGQALAERFTFHLLPTANPRGLERNRGWLLGETVDLLTWFRHAGRDVPADDREFGYGDTPEQAAHPECAAWHAYLERLPGIDGYLSLHSMAFGGGAWFLVQAEDPRRWHNLMAALADAAGADGLPLHDEDRGGRKGFERIAPGFCRAPSREGMRAYFGDTPLRLNSMQVAAAVGGAPVALVSELPQWWDPALADMTPTDTPRAALDADLSRRLIDTCAELDGLEGTAAEREHRLASARALGRLAGDWGDTPAARRDLLAAELSVLRANAQNAVHLYRDARRRQRGAVAAADELRRRVAAVESAAAWQALPLSRQVALQKALILALAEHLPETAE